LKTKSVFFVGQRYLVALREHSVVQDLGRTLSCERLTREEASGEWESLRT